MESFKLPEVTQEQFNDLVRQAQSETERTGESIMLIGTQEIEDTAEQVDLLVVETHIEIDNEGKHSVVTQYHKDVMEKLGLKVPEIA